MRIIPHKCPSPDLAPTLLYVLIHFTPLLLTPNSDCAVRALVRGVLGSSTFVSFLLQLISWSSDLDLVNPGPEWSDPTHPGHSPHCTDPDPSQPLSIPLVRLGQTVRGVGPSIALLRDWFEANSSPRRGVDEKRVITLDKTSVPSATLDVKKANHLRLHPPRFHSRPPSSRVRSGRCAISVRCWFGDTPP